MRRPCVFIMDDPHQFMSSKSLWSDMVREAGKWLWKAKKTTSQDAPGRDEKGR